MLLRGVKYAVRENGVPRAFPGRAGAGHPEAGTLILSKAMQTLRVFYGKMRRGQQGGLENKTA
jgi:hypothetical protein